MKLKFYQLARADTRIFMVGVRQITIDHQSTKVTKTDREIKGTITGKPL